MHKYLKAVGFSELNTHQDLTDLLQETLKSYDQRRIVQSDEDHIFMEFSKEYAYDCGIRVCGVIDGQKQFHVEYFFPYYIGSGTTSYDDIVLEQHADKESFAGACDDMRLGITTIFYLTNAADYIAVRGDSRILERKTPLNLSALADTGKIILPVKKDLEQEQQLNKIHQKRTSLLTAAKNGDEEAIESLTMEDIDTYSQVSKRIQHEDLYSVIDTYFMPHGIECDQYSLMGVIEGVHPTKNSRTGEKLFQMKVSSNGMLVDICINEKDLLGEPAVGRRFKGDIWLLGTIEF